MFRGRFDAKMDPKGRANIPSSYRGVLSGDDSSLVITNSQYQGRRCLDVYSYEEWQKLEKRISKLPSLRSEVQAFQRFYLAGGQVVNVDAQFRFLIPPSLRKYAALESNTVFVGMGHKFEIWSAKIWNELFDGLATDFESILNTVAELEGASE